jgi:Mg-chelatase subunit ChlD
VPGAQPPEELRLDVLFLLDTTGSMSDELERIQDTIDSIAQRIDAFEPRPNVRFGLVAYRDTGDDYLMRDYDFTPDVDAFREVLATFEADGGGDTPEALEEGLHEAVHGVQWSEGAVRLVFLVADAGPHIERELGYTYIDDAQQAVARGIKIYPIAASNTEPDAEYVFRQLAQQTMGRFIFLTYQPGETSGAPGEHREDLAAGEAQQFTVERLDDLIVQIIERELAAAVGAQ